MNQNTNKLNKKESYTLNYKIKNKIHISNIYILKKYTL